MSHNRSDHVKMSENFNVEKKSLWSLSAPSKEHTIRCDSSLVLLSTC